MVNVVNERHSHTHTHPSKIFLAIMLQVLISIHPWFMYTGVSNRTVLFFYKNKDIHCSEFG